MKLYYIQTMPDDAGCFGNLVTEPHSGTVILPEKFLDTYLSAKGFVELTVTDGTVTDMQVNADALAAYEAEHPEPAAVPTLEERVEALEQGGVPGGDSELTGRVEDLEDAVEGLTETVNNLPSGGGEGGDAEAVYNEMAAAYREGVQSA